MLYTHTGISIADSTPRYCALPPQKPLHFENMAFELLPTVVVGPVSTTRRKYWVWACRGRI